MKGFISSQGVMSIVIDMNMERLLSPDKTKHLLPCEQCGDCQWQNLNVVSIVCPTCLEEEEEEEEES